MQESFLQEHSGYSYCDDNADASQLNRSFVLRVKHADTRAIKKYILSAEQNRSE